MTDTGTIGQGVTVSRSGEQGAFGGELLTINFGPHHPSTHGVCLGTSGIELGASTMLMYGFRERDTILDMNEEISGFRMHTSFIRPGGVLADATPRFLDMLDRFCNAMPANIDEYEALLTMNPIFRSRTIGIGRLPAEDAKVLGATGPMLRGSGVAWDLRKSMPYSGYENYDFEIATSD